jgi:hypothetical protein
LYAVRLPRPPSGAGQAAAASVPFMHNDHPVLHSLEAQLQALRDQYDRSPNEQTRYQLVRIEQLITQWVPGAERLLALG